jgi:hypothetical protein
LRRAARDSSAGGTAAGATDRVDAAGAAAGAFEDLAGGAAELRSDDCAASAGPATTQDAPHEGQRMRAVRPRTFSSETS